jgi:hypothetical protein
MFDTLLLVVKVRNGQLLAVITAANLLKEVETTVP